MTLAQNAAVKLANVKPKTVLTYGTFDLFHIGHLNLLRRLRALGGRLVVGVSTDEFNAAKGKRTVVPFRDRLAIVESLKFVDVAFAEHSWEQKVADIDKYEVDIFGMGDDWAGRFDALTSHCEVVYLPRTSEVSSTEFKQLLRVLEASHVAELKQALDLISSIVARFE
jgi:glycerol-3-phosphate cytidylyltransferase